MYPSSRANLKSETVHHLDSEDLDYAFNLGADNFLATVIYGNITSVFVR